MTKIEINKTFANETECNAWKEKNIPNRTYGGRLIFSVNHAAEVGNTEITITDIMVF